jgi:hypothetical protein
MPGGAAGAWQSKQIAWCAGLVCGQRETFIRPMLNPSNICDIPKFGPSLRVRPA